MESLASPIALLPSYSLILVVHLTLVPDYLAVCAAGFTQEKLLRQAVKDLADVVGAVPAEVKCERFQVRLKVFGTDCALTRGAEPTFEQQCNKVRVWKHWKRAWH